MRRSIVGLQAAYFTFFDCDVLSIHLLTNAEKGHYAVACGLNALFVN